MVAVLVIDGDQLRERFRAGVDELLSRTSNADTHTIRAQRCARRRPRRGRRALTETIELSQAAFQDPAGVISSRAPCRVSQGSTG